VQFTQFSMTQQYSKSVAVTIGNTTAAAKLSEIKIDSLFLALVAVVPAQAKINIIVIDYFTIILIFLITDMALLTGKEIHANTTKLQMR